MFCFHEYTGTYLYRSMFVFQGRRGVCGKRFGKRHKEYIERNESHRQSTSGEVGSLQGVRGAGASNENTGVFGRFGDMGVQAKML